MDAARRQPLLTLARLPALATLQCVHVDDLAEGIELAASHPAAAGQVFNMAGVELFSFRDVGRTALLGGANGSFEPYDGPLKYDINKAQSRLGYAPKARLLSSVAAY